MGAFKLGKMTFGSLFKKPETTQYPFETKPQPRGLKGHIVIDADNCIACGMCDRSCSTDCITVDRKARTWEINPYGCVQCGYCITVCPKKCLSMDPNYWTVASEVASTLVQIPEKAKDAPTQKEKAAKDAAGDAPGSKAQMDKLVKAAQEEPALEPEASEQDEQLQRLIDLMDAEKAARVKAALSK